MQNKAFRDRIRELLRKDPDMILPGFEYLLPMTGLTFTVHKRPARIIPGHCLVCNFPVVENARCGNERCQADQTFRLWLIENPTQ